MLSVLVVALTLLALVAGLVIQAVHQEYVIVLRWRKRGTFLLERGNHGRYQIVSPLTAPLVLARFTRGLCVALARSVRSWVAARSAGRLPASVGVKV